MKSILFVIIIGLTISTQLKAETMHELSVHTGITFPQGTFTQYTNNGFFGNVRITSHLNSFESLSAFLNIGGSFFSSDEREVLLTDLSYVTENISEYSLTLHMGTMLGSDSRNSFFRPKIGVAGGLYLFNTQTLLLEGIFDDEEPLAEDNQTQVRVGWRGIIGTDLFFTPKWGLSFEFTYDHVLNLHHNLEFDPATGIKRVGQTARFNSYTIGLIFPLPFD